MYAFFSLKDFLKKIIASQKGFSLIELLVVMVIIGMLGALVGPKLFRHVDTARQKDAVAQIALLEQALDIYRLEKHHYPKSLADIQEYLKKELPKDPWNNPYEYKSPGDDGRDYEIISFGADGSAGGEGKDTDIVSWKSFN